MRSTVPVIVEFYADWCMPCQRMGTVLQKVASQLAGRVKVVKVDIDKNPRLASTFRISSIPAVLLVHHGKVVDRGVGIMPPERLLAMVQKATNKPEQARTGERQSSVRQGSPRGGEAGVFPAVALSKAQIKPAPASPKPGPVPQ